MRDGCPAGKLDLFRSQPPFLSLLECPTRRLVRPCAFTCGQCFGCFGGISFLNGASGLSFVSIQELSPAVFCSDHVAQITSKGYSPFWVCVWWSSILRQSESSGRTWFSMSESGLPRPNLDCSCPYTESFGSLTAVTGSFSEGPLDLLPRCLGVQVWPRQPSAEARCTLVKALVFVLKGPFCY
jgi:hypothetical protein